MKKRDTDLEVRMIIREVIKESYFLKSKNIYWTGYFIGQQVSDEDYFNFLRKVRKASERLYKKMNTVIVESPAKWILKDDLSKEVKNVTEFDSNESKNKNHN